MPRTTKTNHDEVPAADEAAEVEAAAVGDAAPDAAVEPEADEAPAPAGVTEGDSGGQDATDDESEGSAPADAVEDGEDKPKAVLLAEKMQAYLDAGYTHKQLHVQCGAGGLEKVCLLTEL